MNAARSRTVVATLVVGALLTACASTVPTVVEAEIDPASVYGGFTVDPPGPDEVVLTLIGATEVGLTMSDLAVRATTVVRLLEPFVQQEQTFDVVPLAELLALADVGTGDTIDTIALNDYRYRDTVAALLAADALLAVGRDGAPIPMNEGGPIRLVFAEDSSYFSFLDAWNWSLRTIAVVGTD